MKRSTKEGGMLVGLSKLQTACWFKHVYKESGTDSLPDLTKFFDTRGVMAHWKNYSAGRSAPLEPVLDAVEGVLHNSSDYFIDGPERLPLWPILEGDITRAKLTLTRLLGGFDMYSAKRTLCEKWKALFEVLWRERLYNHWENHKVLEDLVREDPNYLAEVLKEGTVVLEAKFMLAIVALAAQCLEIPKKTSEVVVQDREKALEFTYYFMEAIQGKPLANAFDEEVGGYITQWYEEKSA
jgi:hypothetical protein